MTTEEYNIATDIITKLQTLDNSIYDIKHIIQTSDVAKWDMAIRPNDSHPYTTINHKGLLPEFLNMALSKLHEERKDLMEKLEEL